MGILGIRLVRFLQSNAVVVDERVCLVGRVAGSANVSMGSDGLDLWGVYNLSEPCSRA